MSNTGWLVLIIGHSSKLQIRFRDQQRRSASIRSLEGSGQSTTRNTSSDLQILRIHHKTQQFVEWQDLNKHLEHCSKYKAWRRANPSNDCEDERVNHAAPRNTLNDYLTSLSDILPTRGAMTSTKLCEQVLRIIVAGNLSFSFTENPEFIALLRHAYLDCDIPNRRSVAKTLKKAARNERVALREELTNNDSKVSVTLDAWTSNNNIAFLGMYYIFCHGKILQSIGDQHSSRDFSYIFANCIL